MGLKRKMSTEFDDAPSAKVLKLVPFPTYDTDTDVAMSDVSSDFDLIPSHARPTHLSSASSWSSASSSPSPVASYPALEIYPFPSDNNGQVSAVAEQSVGLIQPACDAPKLHHAGFNCTQIPKLRVACESGPGGRRTMWSHCEQCGAITMIDTD
ncbi:hypothetical protein PUNSTDRAFT_50762 [Punctularia strigosozonata HHB-11173 SS5]|uniref:uncharacterized protein n=1 Tax=Punctularia strigosozonata (strain HHB-11173) TaxID=741275 RepID=UPI0004417F4B|nr:uncharacterized protein PUNSTDRAFT_50762 [Punctularia strigosozonata HHB-11173 SS5]EIN11955.1 hypothetical protein PUNSTDRAFT_50762 [Punctularia strigosozonata HHB-11173 SS5]